MSNSHAGGFLPREHPVAQYWRHVDEGLARLGVEFGRFSAADDALAGLMRRNGFANVEQRVFHVPVGPWPRNKMLKSVGVYWKTILMDGLQAIALRPRKPNYFQLRSVIRFPCIPLLSLLSRVLHFFVNGKGGIHGVLRTCMSWSSRTCHVI